MPALSFSHSRKRRLYLGTFHPFLEDSLCSEIKKVRDQDRVTPIIVLVGSNLLGLYLRRTLARKLGFIFNVRFLTFIDLASFLVSERMILEGKQEIPALADKLIIEGFLKKKNNFSYFSEILNYRGFKDSLLHTLADLKEAGISASDFKALIQKVGKKRKLNKDKLQELSEVYVHYSDILRAFGFYDRSDLILEATALMKKNDSIFSKSFNTPSNRSPALFIYGFYDFNLIQENLLNECISVSYCAAFFPHKETSAYKFANKTVRWFQNIGFQLINEKKLTRRDLTQLDDLKRRLFTKHGKSSCDARSDKTFQIISAPGETREVREILRAIIEIISRGVKLSDIGIFLKQREDYLHLFQESFDQHEINYFTPSCFPLSQTREGKSLLLFLSLIGGDYYRGDVMEFLNLADINFEELSKGSFTPSISNWDLISMEAGILSKKKEWIKRLERYVKRMKEYKIIDEDGENIRADLEKIRESERFLEFMRFFFSIMESIPSEGTWRDLSEKIWKSFKRLVRETEALIILEQAIKELRHFERIKERTTMHQFVEFFTEKLNSIKQRKGKFQGGGVNLADLESSRGISFNIIVAPGLIEKRFPAGIRQDPILLDADREEINDILSEERLSLKMDRMEEEKLLFDLLVCSAKEKLILTFPRINPDNAAERVPSFFLLKASEALIGETVDYEHLEKLPFLIRSPLSHIFPGHEGDLYDELEYDLKIISEALRSKKKSEAYFLCGSSPFFKNALIAECSKWGRRMFTSYDGIFNDRLALDLIKEKYSVFGNTVSATSLERYAICPFQYFCEKILKLNILEEPEKIVKISPLDKGWLIHAILFEFFEDLRKEKLLPLGNDTLKSHLKRLDRIAMRLFKKMEQTGRTGFPMMWDIEKEFILKDLKTLIETEMERSKGYIPSHFEVRFGMPKSEELEGSFSTDSPIGFDLGNRKKIFLKGRIDRIDLSKDRKEGIIIDYKTGAARHKNNSFMGGQSLQLPIYIFVAERLLAEYLNKDVTMDSAEYFYITKKGAFKKTYFDKEAWEQKLQTLKKIIRIVSDGIERGLFFQSNNEKTCQYCDYRQLCGAAIDLKFQRKRDDPAIKGYLEMSEIP